jgi:protein-tyrosine phosphatase
MGFVELHFHLLPGADDGPRRMAESAELARAAVADGTTIVSTTPHIHPQHIVNPAEVAPRVRELTARLQREGIRLEVLPGGELSHVMAERLDRSQLDLIAQGPVGRRWVLMEGLIAGLDGEFTAAADRVRAMGFGILLAHPERYLPSPQTTAALEHEIAAGTAFQFNAWSFTGQNGPNAQTLAYALLDRAPAAVISSDAHGLERVPALRETLTALAGAGVVYPERLVSVLPRMLLERGLAPGAVAAAA